MAKGDAVRLNKGNAYTVKGGDKKNIDSFAEMQSIESECGCSIDCCLGLNTTISATTGERIGFYFTGTGGSYTMVIDTYDAAKLAAQALYDAR